MNTYDLGSKWPGGEKPQLTNFNFVLVIWINRQNWKESGMHKRNKAAYNPETKQPDNQTTLATRLLLSRE